MKIKRAGSQGSVRGSAVRTVLVRIEHVPEALTAVPFDRAHPGSHRWQTSIGLSLVDRRAAIEPGGRSRNPANEKHWHGATPTTAMAHIAIQEALNGEVVEWMEKVTSTKNISQEGTKAGINLNASRVPDFLRDLAYNQMRRVRVQVNDKMQNGYVYFRTKPMGRAFRSGVQAGTDTEADARARRVRREIHDRLPPRISRRVVQAREAFAGQRDASLNFFGVTPPAAFRMAAQRLDPSRRSARLVPMVLPLFSAAAAG